MRGEWEESSGSMSLCTLAGNFRKAQVSSGQPDHRPAFLDEQNCRNDLPIDDAYNSIGTLDSLRPTTLVSTFWLRHVQNDNQVEH
jgi:hypothetical protein